MARILADLPDDDIDKLDALAERSGRSRAAEIREAVRLYLMRRSGTDWIAGGCGYWRDRDDIADGVAYQRKLRGGDNGAGG